jgi:hypothetical protein
MVIGRISAVFAAAALLSAVGGTAHAADKIKPFDFTVKSEPTAAAPLSGQTMKMDASKGRFGVTMRLQQPDVRASTLNDVQAGAYYRITPSLRVGGSVSLGEQQLQNSRVLPVQPNVDQPKVRLETAFKF